MKDIIKEVLSANMVVLIVTAVIGYLAVQNDSFESFAVIVLAFILAKQFEK